ncbi:MASE3 domain-containing protein [Undibacterium arcticum]|uniref:MASE3 domain-containing protein n=1 Tax=Undibacterium arcticum TaxID=1762892 RepID=UPI003606127B
MVVLAIAALCIALLDALHMMSVQGLFDINTPANLSRDRYLSLFARAVAAKSLLMIALLPFNSRVRRRAATAALTLAVVTVGVVASLISSCRPAAAVVDCWSGTDHAVSERRICDRRSQCGHGRIAVPAVAHDDADQRAGDIGPHHAAFQRLDRCGRDGIFGAVFRRQHDHRAGDEYVQRAGAAVHGDRCAVAVPRDADHRSAYPICGSDRAAATDGRDQLGHRSESDADDRHH